jgi:membrane fusion protein (multidrug efflux system)
MRSKRFKVWSAATLVLLIGAVGMALLFQLNNASAAPKEEQKEPPATTAEVKRGDLMALTRAQGILEYDGSRQVSPGLAGVLTGLPSAGDSVGQGGTLFSVNNSPVVLLHGSLPVWREFKADMTDGPDVEQLEKGLAALGYFHDLPNQRYDWNTIVAVKAWQKTLDLEQTGTIELGRLQFSSGDVRISKLLLNIGDQVGPGGAVMTVTSADKIVKAELDVADRGSVTVEGAVNVTLPDKTVLTGKIKEIGQPLEVEKPTGKKVVVPVLVSVDDVTATNELAGVAVSVSIQQVSRKDVLSVPVSSLMAISEDKYGVQVVSDGGLRLVEVQTGVFVGGFVEILGGEVKAGDRIVVAG